ncbi:MAG: VTT domain-containing protein [Patescibacteria group bacterium]
MNYKEFVIKSESRSRKWYRKFFMKKEKIIEIIWFVVIVALFIISIKMIRSGELESIVKSFGLWGPLVIILLKITTLVVAPLGGTPLYIISGALFGTTKGLLVCLSGDILGSSLCFWLSRKYGARILNFFAGSQNVDKVLRTVNIISTTRSFVKARIGFISMPELLSYAAGLSRINFWIFSIINTLFYLVADIILVFLGSRLAEFSAKYFLVFPVIIFLIVFSGFVLLYKDYQKAEGM